MSTKTTKKLARAKNFTLQKTGVIKIAGEFSNITDPWSKTKIPNYLGAVDHTLAMTDKGEYEKALKAEETEFNLLVRQLGEAKKSLVVAFQGRDGAGKTGATMRITEALGYDFKIFASVPIGPPSEEELQHYYMWRFSKHERMPAYGQVRIFDRSWQERVLVEKVMEYTPEDKIRDSYAELRVEEWKMKRQGIVLVKIWLDISKKEQKVRFKARKKDKPWKVSASDEIARAHWSDYTPAANELFHRTGSDFAPQFIISSEDKRYSRVTVLQVINQQLREALGK
jgi:AMP-polyphosphate phosphotransferase